MSYTTLIHIWPGERIECGEEFPDGRGSAPVVWDAMCQHWLGWMEFGYWGCIERLGSLYRRRDIPEHQRAVLMMTYDRAYVVRRDYARAAQDIHKFLADFPQDTNRVNHWPRLAEIFEANPEIPALGLYCTSVGDNPFAGAWNEEKGDYDPPNWEDCLSIYDVLAKLATEA